MGEIYDFVSRELDPVFLGLLVAVKANPGISKSGCYPVLDSRWRICSSTSAQWWIHMMIRTGYLVNREDGGISHLSITERGETLLRLVLGVYNELNGCEHTWDECLTQARNELAKKRKGER